MHLRTLTPLMTTAISTLLVCNLAADDRDRIKLTNLGLGEIALWVSEKNKNRPIESTVLKGTTEDSSIAGSFRGLFGTVIAYTDDHPPTIKTGKIWTNGIDTVTMPLDNIHSIGLTVWVVNVGNGDFETTKKKALEASVRTSRIWSAERQGIKFRWFKIIDATNFSISDIFRSESFHCGKASDLKTGIGFTNGEINVYYVETLQAVDNQGNTFEGSAYGEYCGSDNIVALGASSSDDLLVHELGHVFGLEHVDHLGQHFDQTNVMHSASTTRNYLTEGQTFRAIANKTSAINNLYHARAGSEPKVECSFTPTLTCPPIEMRIWRDGDETRERAAQPKEKRPPPMEALQVYLDSDHQDVLEKVAKEHVPPQTMQEVLKFKKDLEPEFTRLLDKGPDDQVLLERERFLNEQWTRRKAFLKTNPNLGLKKADLDILRNVTEQEYIKEGREQLIQRYREKAIGVLRAINSPNGNQALRNFRAKTENRVLRAIIDRNLPPKVQIPLDLPPENPAGLRIN